MVGVLFKLLFACKQTEADTRFAVQAPFCVLPRPRRSEFVCVL